MTKASTSCCASVAAALAVLLLLGQPVTAVTVHDPDGDADGQPAAGDEVRELPFVDEATFRTTC